VEPPDAYTRLRAVCATTCSSFDFFSFFPLPEAVEPPDEDTAVSCLRYEVLVSQRNALEAEVVCVVCVCRCGVGGRVCVCKCVKVCVRESECV